ncbi:hypothetical protein ERD95_15350 [Enterobacteriaceae bacterium ML5]|nr:hypothetical protein ERD95_15350 [Enterobacteriaceae bacterium ML5]
MLRAINLKLTSSHKNFSEFSINDVITGFFIKNESTDTMRVILSETCTRDDSYDFGEFSDAFAAVDAVTDVYIEISEADIGTQLTAYVGRVEKYHSCPAGCSACKKNAAKKAIMKIVEKYHII